MNLPIKDKENAFVEVTSRHKGDGFEHISNFLKPEIGFITLRIFSAEILFK